MSQSIPASVETGVDWCCPEIEANGASLVADTVPHLEAGVAGVYDFTATVPFSTGTLPHPTAAVVLPDDTVTLNGTAVAVPWLSTNYLDSGLDHLVGSPAQIISYYQYGQAVVSAELALTGGAAGDAVYVWLRRYAGGVYTDLPARAVAIFGAAGVASVSLSAQTNIQANDILEVWAEDASGAPVGTVVADPDWSNFRVEIVDPPTISAYAKVYDASGALQRTASLVTSEAAQGTIVLTGLAAFEAEGRLVVSLSHLWPGGVTVWDDAHAEMHWIGPAVEWAGPCSGGGLA